MKPLDERNIGGCSDDRTRDFGGAMMDFATWDKAMEMERKKTAPTSKVGRVRKSTAVWEQLKKRKRKNTNVSMELESKLYSWPDFILNLINKPKEWAGWRKNLERKMTRDRIGTAGAAITRRHVYFLALKEEYLRLQEEAEVEVEHALEVEILKNKNQSPSPKKSKTSTSTSTSTKTSDFVHVEETKEVKDTPVKKVNR